MSRVQPNSQRWILLATILASGMAFLDGTIVNIAIPVIQTEFGVGIDRIQWVVNAFMLSLAALLLVSGSLSDKFGRKRIFNIGIVVFTASSVAAGFSQSVLQMIIWRAIQGVGAAMMIPGSLAIINTSFAEAGRGKAIGLWSGFSGGLAALGPFLGGWLVETFGWPSVFFINLPLGILALAISIRFVPESKNSQAGRVDWLGAVLILTSLFGIVFALIQGSVFGWNNPLIYGSLITGLGLLLGFLWLQAKSSSPLVPLHIFKSKLVAGANLATLFVYFALNGTIFFVVLNLQQVQGLSPLYAGLGLLPPIVLITFLSGPLGGFADRVGPRKPLLIGTLLVGVSMAWLATPGVNASYFQSFFPGLVLFGLGMAFVIAPITKSALAVPHEYSGSASGANNAVARVAGLLAVALLGAIALGVFTSKLTRSMQTTSLSADQQKQITSQVLKFGAIEIPQNFSEAQTTETDTVIKQSFVSGFRTVQIINALGLLAAFLIVLILIDRKKQPHQ